MSQTSFTLGYPKLIHPSLIAVLVDLQSTVIFTIHGTLIGWVHEATKTINFAEGYTELYNALYNDSLLSEKLIIGFYTRTHFKIDGAISYRQWGIKTSFIYPPLPPKPITIDTEDNY